MCVCEVVTGNPYRSCNTVNFFEREEKNSNLRKKCVVYVIFELIELFYVQIKNLSVDCNTVECAFSVVCCWVNCKKRERFLNFNFLRLIIFVDIVAIFVVFILSVLVIVQSEFRYPLNRIALNQGSNFWVEII